MRPLLVSFVAIVLFGTSPQIFSQTQAEMTEDACRKLQRADAALNRIYQQVMAVNAKDANFVKALRESQKAWIVFRDAQVRSIFPDPDPKAYGSVYPMCRCTVLEQITTDRAKELRHLWIDGVDEGDVCTGSRAVKARPNRRE